MFYYGVEVQLRLQAEIPQLNTNIHQSPRLSLRLHPKELPET